MKKIYLFTYILLTYLCSMQARQNLSKPDFSLAEWTVFKNENSYKDSLNGRFGDDESKKLEQLQIDFGAIQELQRLLTIENQNLLIEKTSRERSIKFYQTIGSFGLDNEPIYIKLTKKKDEFLQLLLNKLFTTEFESIQIDALKKTGCQGIASDDDTCIKEVVQSRLPLVVQSRLGLLELAQEYVEKKDAVKQLKAIEQTWMYRSGFMAAALFAIGVAYKKLS